MAKTSIALVSTDPELREEIQQRLPECHVEIISQNPLEEITRMQPTVLIIDSTFDDRSGTLCSKLREDAETKKIPIILITEDGEEECQHQALENEVNDFLIRPLKEDEVKLRVEWCQYHAQREPTLITVGNLSLNRGNQQVSYRGTPIKLTKSEFRLLLDLLDHMGTIRTNKQLAESVWNFGAMSDYGSIRACVKRLRKKIAHTDVEIKTAIGVGYGLHWNNYSTSK